MKRAMKLALPVAALVAQGIDEPALAGGLFLDVDGVNGESVDPAHKDQIDILAWSWGVQNASTTHVGGGGGTVAASFGDLKVIKSVDAATAPLLSAAADGSHFANATVFVQKPGPKGPIEYMTIELENVIVTKVALGARDTEDGVAETVTLNFAKVKITYKETNADGSFGQTTETCWDIAKASGC